MKEESGKAGLKLNIQKTKIVASGPITSWQIDEEKMKIVTDSIFLGFNITVDGESSHVKRRLLLGKKAMTNLDSILKSLNKFVWKMGHIKKHRRYFADWCFWAVVLEKTLESCLNSKKTKPVNPKGN